MCRMADSLFPWLALNLEGFAARAKLQKEHAKGHGRTAFGPDHSELTAFATTRITIHYNP